MDTELNDLIERLLKEVEEYKQLVANSTAARLAREGVTLK